LSAPVNSVSLRNLRGESGAYERCKRKPAARIYNPYCVFSVRCFRLPRLIEELARCAAMQRRSALVRQLAKADLLVLDAFGLTPLSDETVRDLLEILDDRYDRRSAVITSQIPIDNGTPISVIAPSPMQSSIDSCTTATGSYSRASRCAGTKPPEANRSTRPRQKTFDPKPGLIDSPLSASSPARHHAESGSGIHPSELGNST
jgi:hypothetical protein